MVRPKSKILNFQTKLMFLGAGKGVSGNCQAYDSVGGNYWYYGTGTAKEGNYWSNWDGSGWGTSSAYPIDGVQVQAITIRYQIQ
ncbi:MAG: hypothetical protein ACP5LE_00250 [Thermoplasmata archaeon]